MAAQPRSLERLTKALRRLLLDISDDAASCQGRGFRVTDESARGWLDGIGRSFVDGYRAAIAVDAPADLAPILDQVEKGSRGFAYEGAAMGLALRDRLQFRQGHRLQLFLAGPGAKHAYLIHVGAGWARAQLRLPARWLPNGLDPILRWLALDGYGFHQGFFRTEAYVSRKRRRRGEDPSIQSLLDQGLGRSLWFVEGMDPARIAHALAAFASERQGDLWSGVGLACAYAGGASDSDVESLHGAAGEYWSHLAQGACFAAEARDLAGNPSPHCESACRSLVGKSAEEAARTARLARPVPPGSGPAPASLYAGWRRDVRELVRRESAMR